MSEDIDPRAAAAIRPPQANNPELRTKLKPAQQDAEPSGGGKNTFWQVVCVLNSFVLKLLHFYRH